MRLDTGLARCLGNADGKVLQPSQLVIQNSTSEGPCRNFGAGQGHGTHGRDVGASQQGRQQSQEGVEINIDERGVTVTPRAGASAPASSGSDAKGSGFELKVPGVSIRLPPGADAQAVREAVEEARREIRSAIDEAKEDAKDAAREAAEARGPRFVSHKFGEPLMPLTMWFIFISAIIKFTYKGTVAAEAKAAQAT